MAEIEALVQTNELKTNRLKNATPKGARKHIYAFHYDDQADAAMIMLVQPQQSVVVHYLDDHVGFLYEEDSLEIVGLRIDGFVKVFLPAHESVKRAWLNISVKNIQDFGGLAVMFEHIQPKVVREVVRATRPILGPPGAQVAAFTET